MPLYSSYCLRKDIFDGLELFGDKGQFAAGDAKLWKTEVCGLVIQLDCVVAVTFPGVFRFDPFRVNKALVDGTGTLDEFQVVTVNGEV